jgi:polyhydroxybutyrate depolymerase
MPGAATLQRSVIVLALACTLVAPGCGKSGNGTPASGGGGAAAGGAGGSAEDAAPGAGGAVGSGGRTTAGTGGTALGGTLDAGKVSDGTGGAGTGGKPGSGGASTVQATGGATTSVPSSGGNAAAATGGGNTATGGASGGTGGASASVPSAGCGKTPLASGRATLDVSGTSREYILKVPDGYEPNHPYRLIFGFHGAKYDDNWVADGGAPLTGPFFGIESEAKGGAIFVAPQAGSGGWGSQDLPFVDAMVAKLESQLCVDKSRIFSVGFSMGAIMTITIACNRSDVFRAVAPMSGQLPTPCPAGNPIAYWASHGTNDTTIAPSQGQAARDEFVKRNHCTSQTSSPDTNNCATYQGCDQGYPVIWCTFNGQHDPAPFAGSAIWQFLAPL